MCNSQLTVLTFVVLFFADICLKEVPSIADSVYNIQLLREFSNEYLNKCFYLNPEDVLYSPPVLKVSSTKHENWQTGKWTTYGHICTLLLLLIHPFTLTH